MTKSVSSQPNGQGKDTIPPFTRPQPVQKRMQVFHTPIRGHVWSLVASKFNIMGRAGIPSVYSTTSYPKANAILSHSQMENRIADAKMGYNSSVYPTIPNPIVIAMLSHSHKRTRMATANRLDLVRGPGPHPSTTRAGARRHHCTNIEKYLFGSDVPPNSPTA